MPLEVSKLALSLSFLTETVWGIRAKDLFPTECFSCLELLCLYSQPMGISICVSKHYLLHRYFTIFLIYLPLLVRATLHYGITRGTHWKINIANILEAQPDFINILPGHETPNHCYHPCYKSFDPMKKSAMMASALIGRTTRLLLLQTVTDLLQLLIQRCKFSHFLCRIYTNF